MADIRISPLEYMADAFETSSLSRRISHGLFSNTQALLENRGACVRTHFGQVAGSRSKDRRWKGARCESRYSSLEKWITDSASQ